ncbi:KAP family P-loop NTPase fold protein [Sporomusa termitida]|uniref:KAP family P-loop domain protein n=1 Tax=Sporomusa termitida TaxID=2377 RepID=A0A517DWT0_9FIRM|nr:P-loop NTPase fold protein [Sporomusa termitida]QDR81802.1 KAP family P-loop domain protein [Sporomusa termitida]
MPATNFINDCISESDYLGYLPYIKAFEYIICNHNELMSLPVVFGVHGKWGVGKSTFLSLIKKNLDLTNKFFTIELNPWEYGNDNNFVATFLTKLYKETESHLCNNEKKQEDIISTLFKLILKPFKITADLQLAKVEYDFNKLNFPSQKQIIDDFITENFAKKETIKFILNAEIFETKKVIIFIDDLDRCPADKVMEVIESIKLVLNSRNCIFFLGCDKEYLENALSLKYKDFIQFCQRRIKNDRIAG